MLFLNKKYKKKLFKEQQGRCYYCNCEMVLELFEENGVKNENGSTFEHLHKQCDGGTNVKSNIVLACHTCNTCREDVPAEIWRLTCTTLLPIYKKRKKIKKKIKNAPLLVNKKTKIRYSSPTYKFYKKTLKRPLTIVVNNYYNLIITLIIKKAEKQLNVDNSQLTNYSDAV